jgi:hypothetical protein
MRRNHWLLFLLAAVLAGLTGLTACGGGSGGNGGGGGGGGTNPPLTGLTIYPGANGTTVSVAAGSTVQFTAYQADALVSVNWTASGGTITGNGTSSGAFTAPTAQGSVTVSAVSTSSATTGGSVTVNVTAPSASGILVNPGATVVAAGGTTAFSATLNGGAVSPAPTWQVNGTNGGDGVHGTIDGNGNYTAPLTPPPGGSTTITAVSGGNSATASVTVVYSNLSFSGPYAFSYTGNDGNGFLTVAGSFVADGSSGSITSGEEDYVDSAVLTSPATFGGTFAVGPDGRGSLTISSNAPDSTGVIQFSLTNGQQGGPAQHAVLIRLDTLATGSGTIDVQTDLTAQFSGNYIFASSGLDNIFGNSFNLAGKFFVDGATLTLPALDAEQDFNYGGTSTSATNGGPDLTLYGSFTMDADASTTGRGTLLLNTTNSFLTTTFGVTSPLPLTFQYTFYVVDSSHLKIVESDTNFIMSGDIFAETSGAGPYTAANLLPSSNYAFTTGGSSTTGPFGTGGVFVSGGGTGTATSGSITGGVYDNNNAGATKLDETITSSSFSIDTFGRINLSLDPGATYSYAGYAGTYNSANGPVNVVEMIDLEQNYLDSGLAYRQTSGSTPSGSFALNMTAAANKSGTEQDFEGQFGIGNTGTITGNLDINNAEVNGIQANVPFTSSSITTVGTDGRGTPLTLHTSSPTTNYPLAYYVIDDNTSLVFETDGVRVLTGIIQKQY